MRTSHRPVEWVSPPGSAVQSRYRAGSFMPVMRPGERTTTWWHVERVYVRADFDDTDQVGKLLDWAASHAKAAGRFALYRERYASGVILIDLLAGEDPSPPEQ